MSTSATPEDEIRQLFRKHVPEVAAGTVELVSIAREVGDRVFVAVRSNNPSVHAVSACVGVRGVHPKNMVRELGGEKVTIVLWSESPETFVLNALGPFGPGAVRTPKVALDVPSRTALVAVSAETLAYFSEQGDWRVRLASRLVRWNIQFVSHELS